MSKQLVAQKYIYKIHTDRLKRANWDLTITLPEARYNEEVISIGDSQMLRWIDELNGIQDTEERVREIRREIRALRRQDSTVFSRRRIRELYAALDALQFKPDYMHLVVDRNRDYIRACRGFTINGIKYVRLVGTSGGIKLNTIVFVSERLAPTLRERIDNGRNASVPLVPAKLEAYRALTCSGSTPVSEPSGVLVVNDCVTHFTEDVLYLTDEGDGEPEITHQSDFEVELTESDGYGLMLPSLARRWSDELRLGYTVSCVNTRMSWEKGCVFTFDFIDFAEKVAGTYLVRDAWGNEVDIRNVELILTTSMLKLWNCYDSIDSYLENCRRNHYTFCVSKTAPEVLEDRRALNYQFIQSYELTDAQIDELIRPTMDTIRDVIVGDYRKALLFMAGTHLDERCLHMQQAYIRAMMIDSAVYNDPFIRSKIQRAIRKRIDDAKIGVLDVHGNYSILCGDPYALCQSVFGLEVTGLMKAGEIYNKYWVDCGAGEVAVFRAPMSCANNILKRRVASSEEAAYWYQHIRTCTLFNAWDGAVSALNGADKDGDIVFLTDNEILVGSMKPTLTLVCAQKSAKKSIVTEKDLIRSNIAGFGNDVGKVTNRVTSMYDVQARFSPGSVEYETLAYRIMSGQQFQQNTIDKTKGIVCKPMPKYWYDYRAVEQPETDDADALARYELNRSIVANRKPYFMCYVYPVLMKEYKTYVRNTDRKSLIEFGIPIAELTALPDDMLTERQRDFLHYYNAMMPVSMNDCTMNRICRRIERIMDDIRLEARGTRFDCSILKSCREYSDLQFYSVKKLFERYSAHLRDLAARYARHHTSKDAYICDRAQFSRSFIRDCECICSNHAQLGDIIVDLCYGHSWTKQLAWDLAGDIIVDNMLARSGGVMKVPMMDPDGDIEYCGNTFSMSETGVDVDGTGFE